VYSFLQRCDNLLHFFRGGQGESLRLCENRYENEYLAWFRGDGTGYVTHYFWVPRRIVQGFSGSIANVAYLCIISIMITSTR
jgi:hypothetical protein